tara:strand:- start:118 stop:873 length:756 start_codon:yes stop_codon:yes gene_type:complete
MPTFIHGKATKIYVDEFDLSPWLNSAEMNMSTDTAEVTSFNSTTKAYIKGLADGTLSVSGMWSADTDGSDEELHALLGNTTTPVITVAESGDGIGNSAIMTQAHEVNYAISNPVSDVSSLTADFNSSADNRPDFYGIRSGIQLTAGASIDYNALGNLTGHNHGSQTTGGGMAIIHVPTNSINGATTIKVQHDASSGFGSAADLVSFTNVGASTKTSELVAISGTIKQYVRVTASTAGSSGSITFMVSLARF